MVTINKWLIPIAAVALLFACTIPCVAQTKLNGWDTRFSCPGIKDPIWGVKSLVANKKYLYVGGHFSNIGAFETSGLARWDGQKWFDLSASLIAFDSEIVMGNILALDSSGVLFTTDYYSTNIYRWDGKKWDYIKAPLPYYAKIEELFIYHSRLVVKGTGLYDGFAQFNGKDWIPLYPINSIEVLQKKQKAFEEQEKQLSDSTQMYHSYRYDSITIRLVSGTIVREELNYEFTKFANTGKYLYMTAAPHLSRDKNDIGLCRWEDSLWICISDSQIRTADIIGTVGSNLFCNVLYKTDSSRANRILSSFDGSRWKMFRGKTPLTVDYVLPLNNQLYTFGYTQNPDKSLNGLLSHWVDSGWICIPSDLPEHVTSNGNSIFYISNKDGGDGVSANIASFTNGTFHSLSPGPALGFMENPSAIALYKNNIFTSNGETWSGKERISAIAKWCGDSWSEMGAQLLADSLLTLGYRQLTFSNLESSDEYVYTAVVCATPTIDMHLTTDFIFRWDGLNWARLGTQQGFHCGWGDIRALLAVEKDQLYVAGAIETVDGVVCNNIAFWNGHSWEALANGLSKLPGQKTSYYRKNGMVYSLCIVDNELYASGNFTQAYGTDMMDNIARYDGKMWHSLEDTLKGQAGKLAVYHGEMITTGWYTEHSPIEGKLSSFLAVYRNKKWVYLSPPENMLGKNYTALYTDSSYIYCATDYSDTLHTGGRVYRWDGSVWEAVSEPFYYFDIKDFVIKDGYLYAITNNEFGDFCSGFGILKLPKK